ncbi:MAG: ATP synthase F1 subunit gamma [Candidatus Saganbacteria bacterium]|nr:ATP synthase F1 subunit gamma [Candidatus Saganbacteria bacterium]
MRQLVDIKRRLKAIIGIAKITEAMQIITVVRMKKSQDALKQAQKFFQEAESLIGIVGLPSFDKNNKSKLTKIMVIGSNRGFCGSFNYALFPKLELFLAQAKKEGQKTEVLALGEKIAQYLRRNQRDFTPTEKDIIEKPSSHLTRQFVEPIYQSFVKGSLGKLIIIYNHFKSAAIQIPTVTTLLPLPIPDLPAGRQGKIKTKGFLFEPSLEELQKEVLKLYVESALHLYIMESINGELGTRLINMRNATDNSKKLITQLTLFANKARQAGITQELAEISGAFEALKGGE